MSLRHKLFESAWANGRITLFDSTEAEDAIPELVAFWLFLQRQYNLRSAAAVVKYLESLASKFPAMMSDPKRGGIAKAFLMMGQQSGFDKTTPEDVEAFQQQYNDNPKAVRADWVANTMGNIMQGAVPYQPKSEKAKKPKTGFGEEIDRKKTNRKKK